ncbi:MAG: carboxypeptidase-like regulatory domain-containing protein [Cyclobacteriaceae bacterium]
MRHSILLLIGVCCSLHCLGQNKNERITLSFENIELEVIFDSLSAQTGYFFSYNSDLLPKGSKYSISTEDLPIDQFLSELLVGTNLKYSFFKDQIIIHYEAPEQNEKKKRKLFSISGTVTDEWGNPLKDVNVFLDGTTIGISTDIDGNYRLNRIPPGYYDLVFSYVGYKNAVYDISEYNGGSRIQRHKMEPSISELQEVEVVAERITNEYDTWYAFFELFQNDLFGTSFNAGHCYISNPEVISFTYHESNNKLVAFATEPIKIRNEAMAYQITYFLESFERTDTDLRYRGQIKFQNDYNPDGGFTRKQIRAERKKSYNGSWNHFRKSLLEDRLKKDGFKISRTKDPTRIKANRLKPTDAADILVFKGKHWELDFKDYLVVFYNKEKESLNFLLDTQFSSVIYADSLDENRTLLRNPGKQISLLKLLKRPLRIDLNGQVMDSFASTSFGYWAWERLANLVPLNYDPKYDNF